MVEIKEPNLYLKEELKQSLKGKQTIFPKGEVLVRNGTGYYNEIDYGDDLNEDYEVSFRNNKPIVEEILNAWDKSRNNDVLLYFEFLRTKFEDIKVTSSKENVIFKFPKKIIKYLNSPETITRIRRIFNAKGLYLPTDDKVIIRRMKRQKVLAKYFKK